MRRRNVSLSSDRAVAALRSVLPPAAQCVVTAGDDHSDIIVNGRGLELKWAGEGDLGDVSRVLAASRRKPDIVAARWLSPGARERLSSAGVGWVDETGAAEIVTQGVIVSRSGRPPAPGTKPPGWTPAALAVAEAIMEGTGATVQATSTATGLSTGSCTASLKFLSSEGLISAAAARGRGSGRAATAPQKLLQAYAAAAAAIRPVLCVVVGALWRNPIQGVAVLGDHLNGAGVQWAVTGTLGAHLLAPHLTEIGNVEIYVDASTTGALDGLAASLGLRPLEGGRLVMRPPATVSVFRLAGSDRGIRIAPWARVYADLRTTGVRGEDAAEHLAELMLARRA